MNNVKTVPHQKVIVMPPSGERIRDKQHKYGMFSIDEAQKVALELGSSAFVLYMYLQKNQDGYEFALSPADVKNWGLGKTAYDNSVAKLIEYGYLVQKQDNSNIYYFHECPRSNATQLRKDDNNSRSSATQQRVVMPHNNAWLCDDTTRGSATQQEIIQNTKIKNNTEVSFAAQSAAPPAASGGEFFSKIKELESKLYLTADKNKRNIMLDNLFWDITDCATLNQQVKEQLLSQVNTMYSQFVW